MTIQASSTNKKLFLSAVSSEFESYRQLLANDLKRPRLDLAVQEDFVVSGGSTLQKLDDYIKACDGIVHLIGKATGATPEPVAVNDLLMQYPDFAQRLSSLAECLKQSDPAFSYTQWEAYLAIYHKRPIFIYRPNDFELDERTCPREGRFVYEPAQEKSQREHYSRICSLGRDRGQFLNQERLSSAVLRDLVEILPRLKSHIDVPPTKLRHTAEVLIGRDEELTMLDEAWNDPHKNVVVVRGKGGEGKTSLVASWMAEMAMKDWRGAGSVFDWSFYSQGTKDQGTASAEQFIVAALTVFGDVDPNRGAFEERGTRLAQLVGSQRSLLVLDGLEPLQYPPGPMHGQLTDKGMAALLKGLAGLNTGLCVVTTREKVDEIKQHYGKSAIDHALEFLSPTAGAALLHYAGARRAGHKTIAPDDKELQQASVEVNGHALTLFLIGQYLKLTEDGDIRRRDRMKLADAEAQYKNDATRPYGHAFKAIEAYETWFAKGDEQAKRQLAILRLLGLFDRPASKGCLTALRSEPKIMGLNDALAGGSDKDWTIALNRLQEINLVSVKDDESVDCHPLIREYFAAQFKVKSLGAWLAGHKRLYEYLRDNTKEGEEPTLDDLQPLYQAVTHGCHADLPEETFTKVYWRRISRGKQFYATTVLGAIGSCIQALLTFENTSMTQRLSTWSQGWILSELGYHLRTAGQLRAAEEPLKKAWALRESMGDWKEAAVDAGTLSDAVRMQGRIVEAVGLAREALRLADQSKDLRQKMVRRITLAVALHQAGKTEDSNHYFRQASNLESLVENSRFLFSRRGFHYRDLLLDQGRYDQVIEETLGTLARVQNSRIVLDIALDHLSLARGLMFRDDPDNPTISYHLDTAVEQLRLSGYEDFRPYGLLARACFASSQGKPRLARADLDQAQEIAERGPMRLHMADIHLYRARLFHAVKPYPWNKFDDGTEGRGPKDDLADARKLIEQCGYWRRKEELEDAEEAAKNWKYN